MAWSPQAERQPSPNFWPGYKARSAVVLHINQGHFQSSIDYMARAEISAHFEVGLDGRIAQLVDTDNSAWANGLSYTAGHWFNPRGALVHPTWLRLREGINPNYDTISVECEGYSGNPIPAPQSAAIVALLQWLAAAHPELSPYAPGLSLIGHCNLDNVDRPFCPGKAFDFPALAAAANHSPDPFAAWGPIGLPQGEACGWAIPRLWLQNKWLGACILAETYSADGSASVALFAHGTIVYRKTSDRAEVSQW